MQTDPINLPFIKTYIFNALCLQRLWIQRVHTVHAMDKQYVTDWCQIHFLLHSLTMWLDMTSSSSVIISPSKVLPLMSFSFKHPLPSAVSPQLHSFFYDFPCLSPHRCLPLLPLHTSALPPSVSLCSLVRSQCSSQHVFVVGCENKE